MSSARSADQILAFLESRRSNPTPQAERLKDSYRKAAAVLVALRNPDTLQPVGATGKPGEGVKLLGPELIRATGRRFDGKLMLHPDSRRKAISEMSTLADRRKALDANPSERTGDIQPQLEKYLLGTAAPLENQSPKELDETLQVAAWLHEVIADLPKPDEVRARLAYQSLLQPFEGLAGDSIFRGRRKELDQLRSYVGVLAPEALLRRLSGLVLPWTKPNPMAALSVSGPGGIGKSALIARFMLEHSRVPKAARIPFAYLDFDRPSLNITEAGTLLGEMLRQIDVQFAEEGYFHELRQFFEQKMGTGERPIDPREAENYDSRVFSVIADLVGLIEARLGPRPYVVVLDTFEEVQYRGENRAFPLWQMLGAMQSARPFLRVVVSGRAPVNSLELAERPPNHIELSDLDNDAATAFVQAQGIQDLALAQDLVRQFGGVPLSLKLAASVVKREGGDAGVKSVEGKSTFWFSASDEVIQGTLYSRILSHLHDPALQRLAHPGLVLRRITPELILKVLNLPCQLGISTMPEAVDLFEKLKQEPSLVISDTTDSSLVHRPDLRRAILKMLQDSAPAQTRAIHVAAIDWYKKQQGWRAQAEALYHQLQLGWTLTPQDIRLLQHPDIRVSLQASISELPGPSQLLLATNGYQVAPEIMDKASNEEQERSLAAAVEDQLPFGSGSVDYARRLVEKGIPDNRWSPLFRSAARIAAQQQRDTDAARLLEDGLRLGVNGASAHEILFLLSEQAWLFGRNPQLGNLPSTLSALGEQARRCDVATFKLQHRIQSFTFEAESNRPALLREIASLFAGYSAADLWDIFPLFGQIVGPLSEEAPASAVTLMRLIGQPDSPFARVEFSEGNAREPLYELLSSSHRFRDSRDSMVTSRSLYAGWYEGIIAFGAAWPYRVLLVKPPYSSSSFESEAKSLR